MKVIVQVTIESDAGQGPVVERIACLERANLDPGTLGLKLEEAKDLLARIQEAMVTQQVAEYVEQQRRCPDCGKQRSCRGEHEVVYRTLVGHLKLCSPRLRTCACPSAEHGSVSPLAELLPERTAPELLYLQTKWAALMSYGPMVDLLEEVLPLHTNRRAVYRHLEWMAERSEQALSDKQLSFIDGCPRDWKDLPIPEGPLTVGIDGGYVHGRDEERRQAGSFEVIVGKSIPDVGKAKCFAFVNGYDPKPKRRLYEVLKSQGLQMNQVVTFLSDGGDTVRQLQYYLNPQAEHLLDWFHVTMRLTVLQQTAKGRPAELCAAQSRPLADRLDCVKWFLWHGNVYMALQRLDDLLFDLDGLEQNVSECAVLIKRLGEFVGYISANRSMSPNYGDRYRYGECIATGFVGSTVNQVISKRFEKKQQMRWTKRGAHLLLQVRTKVINEEWRGTFSHWYLGMATADRFSSRWLSPRFVMLSRQTW